MKKLTAILTLIALMTACCSAFAASGTYTAFFSTEELSGSVEHTGYIAGVQAQQKNTLVLNDDGTYEYTKLVGIFDENQELVDGMALSFLYTGNYEEDGDTITLKAPAECVFSENWGGLAEAGHLLNSEGTASAGDLVNCKEGTTHDPMKIFPGAFYKEANEVVDTVITINADGTFSYNAVASSDDD